MNKKTIQDWKLEQYLLGELSPEELESISVLESSDEIIRDRIDTLRKDNAETLEKFPPAWEIRRLRTLKSAQRIHNHHGIKKAARWAIPATVSIASAAVIIIAQIFTSQTKSSPPAPNALIQNEQDSTTPAMADDATFTRDSILLEQGW